VNPHYPSLARRAGHRCEYCHAPEIVFNFPFEVEHIIPVSRQGADDDSNRALACRACNLHKSDHLTGEDEASRREERLFNPRRDSWDVHFRVEAETGVIHGLTPEGRATVGCLRINAPLQLEARRQWMRLGLFP